MKTNLLLKIGISLILTGIIVVIFFSKTEKITTPGTWWKFQSIDTMKYSRDLARQELNNKDFDKTIDKQTKAIADTGATYIAIATPYDEEFYPILKRWVISARKYNLHIWFRGNWSGWEGWFGYSKITESEHIQKTGEFIIKHKDLFANGDVFTACPECENGGMGDPRETKDVLGYRNFLIEEYSVTKSSFKTIKKDVLSNFDSMNGDVAKLIMDKKTTKALDGVVTIDHYVTTPEKLISDIRYISAKSGGKVVLGEFGAPIPDINGDMTQDEQAEWISKALNKLVQEPEVIGINYWTNMGSSTSLWNNDNTARKAVDSIKSFYKVLIYR